MRNETTAATDPFDLERFVDAQERSGAYVRALGELRAARKQTHWIWFVFPQIAGLGHSEIARHYAISGLDEARAYLTHGLLGPRLRECARLVADTDVDATVLLGELDAVKLRSSMTLFDLVAPHEAVFAEVLERHFGGERDTRTIGSSRT